MKKVLALTLCFILAFPHLTFAVSDERIFTDTAKNVYTGRKESVEMITNLNFNDVPATHWAAKAIARGGSLNMIKGYGKSFSPGSAVTNEEALAFVLRIAGLENDALAEAVRLRGDLNTSESLKSLWSIGYISVARNLGIITNQEYQELIADSPAGGAVSTGNSRTSPASREKIAYWLAGALSSTDTGLIDLNSQKQAIFSFADWESVNVTYAAAVNEMARLNIMVGDNGNFKPKANLTRAEMAQVLKNMGGIYNTIYNLETKTGTVGGIRNNYEGIIGTATSWRNFYIRTSSGDVDIIQHQIQADSSGNETKTDVVVFKNGKVTSLSALTEGDQIEYLYSKTSGEVMYIEVLLSSQTQLAVEESYTLMLHSVNMADGTITVQDTNKASYVYHMMEGIYGKEKDMEYLVIDQKKNDIKKLPIGSNIKINLKNQTVDSINFVGNPVIITETRGIVTENNTDYGYLSFIDNKGNEITKNYYADSIEVKKQEYYDLDDEIGYLDQVFSDFRYNPKKTDIGNIEPGDIIFIRYDKDDPEVISYLSASTNYVAKYGKITQITHGESISRFLVEYEDKQTTWYDVADGIFSSRLGKPVALSSVKVGDWAKFLVNQAIISPGYVMESVKEVNVEGEAHFISNIVKGQLSGIDPTQKKLILQNSQTLSKAGWSDYNNLQSFSINSNDIEYYYDSKQISLDYAEKFLKRSQGEVYIALENSAQGERVKKVTFRTGRDELLKQESVLSSDGSGSFTTISSNITTDSGTIVRRYGRLVSSNNISSSDYTVVSLNGGNKAAIVDITDSPDITGIMVARARILSVDEGKSFKSQSMSILSGNSWLYTPVQREFTIDYNTIFFNEAGVTSLENFRDYTADSAIDKVFNVVYEGSKATKIYEAPYCKEAVKGTIYAVSGTTISLKDAMYLDSSTNKWLNVSRTNNTITVNIHPNTLIGKNNQIVSPNTLAVGDEIRAMTNTLPAKIESSSQIDSYILFVEK